MTDLNRASLIGRLGKDPESRSMQNGGEVVSFSIATAETWKDKSSGEKRERTQWHNIVIFNEGLGKVASQYLRKGHKVFIEGAIETRKWTDKNDVERYSTEIVLKQFNGQIILLEGRNSSGGGEPGDEGARSSGGGKARAGKTQDELDDSIPF